MEKRGRGKTGRFFFAVGGIVFLLASLPVVLQGADFGVEKVTVNDRPVSMMEAVNLTDEDLIGGKIVIAGHSDSQALEYSLDAGRVWDQAAVEESQFRVEFDPGDNARDFTILLRTLSGGSSFAVIVRYRSRRYQEVFERLFAEIRDLYIDERLNQFLEYFDRENYDNFVRFEENMEETFDYNANINLHISVAEVEVIEDAALVRLDWERNWDDSSRASAVNNIVRFKRSEGRWRITDIEDEGLFIIGSGTFRGNVSDRR